jgi:hypothetical protein
LFSFAFVFVVRPGSADPPARLLRRLVDVALGRADHDAGAFDIGRPDEPQT